MEFSADTRATYLPADPPREGVLALWGDEVAGGTTIELVLPRGARFARTKVEAELVPLERALPRLLSVGEEASPAVAAWSAAVNAGVNLVARGRLRPAVSPAGAAAWVVRRKRSGIPVAGKDHHARILTPRTDGPSQFPSERPIHGPGWPWGRWQR